MGRKITLCALIAGFILVVAGIIAFMNGFHNVDLAFNLRTLEKHFNVTLIENAGWIFLPETKQITINELYNYGVSDLFNGIVAVLLGSLMVGYNINNGLKVLEEK